MAWLKEKDIISFLNQHNYDIRASRNARWIDQKCAADVITVVADCIMQFVEEQGDKLFSSMDIWHSEYTVSNVENSFKKPNPDEKKARNEYDKFFQQPMEMMAYAGILEKHKKGNRNFYMVKSEEILEHLALREKNSLDFLCLYIEKVLRDSSIYEVFNSFFKHPTKQSYEDAKDTFTKFTIQNTPINGSTECWRIFIKVMNPLAYKYNSCGTEKGRMSKHKITYDMLMYNRDNFRDIYSEKPKDLTRRQYEEKMGYKPNPNYFAYQSQKAKKFMRKFNDIYRDGKTEVWDERHIHDKAINIHHIFPEAEYPQICMYYENLIALTPTQHFSYAHPLGNTQRVDYQFQYTCLLAKTGSIKENIESSQQETVYEFGKFLFVLTVGFDDELFEEIEEMDFDGVVQRINMKYV